MADEVLLVIDNLATEGVAHLKAWYDMFEGTSCEIRTIRATAHCATCQRPRRLPIGIVFEELLGVLCRELRHQFTIADDVCRDVRTHKGRLRDHRRRRRARCRRCWHVTTAGSRRCALDTVGAVSSLKPFHANEDADDDKAEGCNTSQADQIPRWVVCLEPRVYLNRYPYRYPYAPVITLTSSALGVGHLVTLIVTLMRQDP